MSNFAPPHPYHALTQQCVYAFLNRAKLRNRQQRRTLPQYLNAISVSVNPQVRSEMAAKRTLMVYRLNKAAFDYVIGEIHAKFMTSKVLLLL